MAVANLSPFLSLPSLLNKKLELGGLTDEGGEFTLGLVVYEPNT